MAAASEVLHPQTRDMLGLSSALPETVRAAFEPVADEAAGEAYARQLTRSHYENFSVVSVFLPKQLRQDFCNVYAFCRVADDLGDEIPDKRLAAQELGRFRQQLAAMYEGLGSKEIKRAAETAVFSALLATVRRHDIPIKPFDDLISAFEQDQTVSRYETFEQVVDYCTRSADPVGRIVLYLCGYRDEERQRLSDKTCTALQLINFWQDVRRDMLERDRIYLPAGDMKRFGVTEEQLRTGRVSDGYRELIRFEVERTEAWFDEGAKLLPMLAPAYRKQIALFGKGGRAICAAVRRQSFDTLSKRATPLEVAEGAVDAGRSLWGRRPMTLLASTGPDTNAAETLEQSRAYCRDLTRRAARNFYYGLKLLPEAKRRAMFALYGYMRLVDDIADDDENQRTLQERKADLDQWEALTYQAIAAARQGGNLPRGHTVWPAFAEMVRNYHVPEKVFSDMIAGQRQDLEPVAMPDFSALHAYCYRVASVVGVASLYVFGFEERFDREATLQLGVDRGIAFQLTNVLRDLREDAGRGRCYIPRDELQAHGVTTEQLSAGDPGGGIDRLMRQQIERARAFYDKSASLEERIQRDARPTLSAMTYIYRAILEKIAADPSQVLTGRVRLSGWTKLRIAWRAMRRA